MRFTFLLPLLFAFGCTTKTNDTASTSDNAATAPEIQDLSMAGDSLTILVEKVNYFSPTRQPYVALSFNNGYTYDSLERIKADLDSLVFDDDEIKRSLLPMAKAAKYFNLILLDSISIFSHTHLLLGTAYLEWVEFLEDILGDQFIAVFKTEAWINDGAPLYGISGTQNFFAGLTSEALQNEALSAKIRTEFNTQQQHEWNLNHRLIQPYDAIYSLYSFNSGSGEETSYLVETKNNQQHTLMKLVDEYSLWEVVPVRLQLNEKPVLLVHAGFPETDIEWYSPAVYDGEAYRITHNSRIQISEYIRK